MGEPTASSSSGLAMRRPPSDCERLRSPDMLRGRSQCRWPAERRGGWRAGRRTSEGCGGAWGGGCRQRLLYSERGRMQGGGGGGCCAAAAARNSAAEQTALAAAERRAERRVVCSAGVECNAMQCRGYKHSAGRVQCIAVYIRVDRRAQCDLRRRCADCWLHCLCSLPTQVLPCHERSPNRSRLHPKAQTLLLPRRSQDPQSKHNLPRDNACLDTRSLFSLMEEAASTSPVRFLCI